MYLMSCPLYIRSVYTLLSSMCSIEGIVSYAKKYGYKSVGLVDRNVLSGAMSFKKACLKNDIKPIFGLEVEINIEDRNYVVVLYARDDIGFKNLMALSSYICINDNKIIDIDVLNKYKDHNILCLLSDNMPLTYYVDKKLDLLEGLNKQKEIFGEYIVGLVDHDIAINAKRDLILKDLFKKNNILCIALNRTYYLNVDDNEDYEVLKCIRDKKTIDDVDNNLDSGRHLLNMDEFSLLFEKQELDNTDYLASICNVDLNYQTTLPEYINKKQIPSKDYLISLCKEGLRRRLKNNINKEYADRLNYELKVIINMHFEDYFLIVYDFILYAKKNNILVGPGRGSGAGSLVAYCLGITDIDPIKYGLIFERFLNPERISMPDIDTDFPDDKRDKVIEYVRDKYGKDHVGHIITYGTLKAKQVLRDVARALNYSSKEVDGIAKLIPNTLDMNLQKAYDEVGIFRQTIESDSRYRKLFKIAKKLEFFPRHESTHAAGIVLSKKPLSEVVPVIKIENDLYSTQYTMEHLEELGLIKMDFLSIRNLSIIAEIVDDINNVEKFSIKDIPLDDSKTFELIDNVNVLGVFQLESSGMRNLIRKMKPRTFEEIGMTIALFRPGPMKNIPIFLENRAHPDKINYLHENLRPILKETYGIIVYQEQIIQIARVMAGFTYGKADILRKAMSKKKLAELEKLYPDFINGCINNGYDKSLAQKIYDLILEFANYGFNKSHSVAYALVAYQLAYLKANYPLYFYKALLNGAIGSESKTYDYISECLNIKQKVKGVNINHSDRLYKIEDNQIIMPLSICKDVGSISVDKIIEERQVNGPYLDYVSTVCRLVNKGVDKNVIENLIYAGAFDEFKYGRYTMIKALGNVLMYASAHKGQLSLIDNFDDAPIIENYKDDYLLLAEYEKQVLGFYFTFNPIIDLKKKHNINTDNLYNLSLSRGNVKGFGLINRVKAIKTKRGDMMAFVDLVDDMGQISLAVMPDLYNRYSSLLIKGKYVLFEGKIEKEASCLVKKLEVI